MQNLSQISFVYKISLKLMFKPGFGEQNFPLNLCSYVVVNSKMLFCSQKVECNVRIKVFWHTKIYSLTKKIF